MKKTLLILLNCLLLQAFCSFSGKVFAQTVSSDTLYWSWEVSSTVSTHTKTLTIAFDDNLMINWGDGVTEWIPDSLSAKTITHVYSAQANYLCTATGTGITYFKADSRRLLSLETLKAPNLTYISCSSCQIKTLDVSKNPLLVSLYCGGNSIDKLDLSKNVLLQTLTCSDNMLKVLDVSMLPSLKKVTAHTNLIQKINVNSSGALSYLSCAGCNLSANALDSLFNDLPALKEVSASKNLYVLDNPGSSSCHSEIAIQKNWTLDRVITQSSFYIPSISCRMNDSATVSLNLKNVVPAIAFEIDLLIPEGFVLDTVRTCLVDSRKGQHTLSVAKISETSQLYKFMAYSMKSKDLFSGTDGAIMNIFLKSPSVNGVYDFDISNAVLVDTLTNIADVALTDGKITVSPAANMGDANGDEQVNVTDIVFLVAKINGRQPSGFVSDAADMDGNGKWNVADITKIVEKINSQQSVNSVLAAEKRSLGRSPNYYNASNVLAGNHMFLIQTEKNPAVIELCMSNHNPLQAFQVDMILPDNVRFKPMENDGRTYRSRNHVFSLAKIPGNSNRWRLISYALHPDMAYADTSGAVAVLKLECDSAIHSGVYEVYMENKVFTGMDMLSATGYVYDASVELENTLLSESACDICADDGLLKISGSGIGSVDIWNMTGTRLITARAPADCISTYSLNSGIYFVKVHFLDSNKTVCRKICVP